MRSGEVGWNGGAANRIGMASHGICCGKEAKAGKTIIVQVNWLQLAIKMIVVAAV